MQLNIEGKNWLQTSNHNPYSSHKVHNSIPIQNDARYKKFMNSNSNSQNNEFKIFQYIEQQPFASPIRMSLSIINQQNANKIKQSRIDKSNVNEVATIKREILQIKRNKEKSLHFKQQRPKQQQTQQIQSIKNNLTNNIDSDQIRNKKAFKPMKVKLFNFQVLNSESPLDFDSKSLINLTNPETLLQKAIKNKQIQKNAVQQKDQISSYNRYEDIQKSMRENKQIISTFSEDRSWNIRKSSTPQPHSTKTFNIPFNKTCQNFSLANRNLFEDGNLNNFIKKPLIQERILPCPNVVINKQDCIQNQETKASTTRSAAQKFLHLNNLKIELQHKLKAHEEHDIINTSKIYNKIKRSMPGAKQIQHQLKIQRKKFKPTLNFNSNNNEHFIPYRQFDNKYDNYFNEIGFNSDRNMLSSASKNKNIHDFSNKEFNKNFRPTSAGIDLFTQGFKMPIAKEGIHLNMHTDIDQQQFSQTATIPKPSQFNRIQTAKNQQKEQQKQIQDINKVSPSSQQYLLFPLYDSQESIDDLDILQMNNQVPLSKDELVISKNNMIYVKAKKSNQEKLHKKRNLLSSLFQQFDSSPQNLKMQISN